MIRYTLVLLLVSLGLSHALAVAQRPAIAIIIDDIGYRYDADRAALDLPGPVTYAILPHTHGADSAIKLAHAQGKDVMLHLPMQSSDKNLHKAPGTLSLDMDWLTFVRGVQTNLAAVPGAVAVNNHEGSTLTANPQRMDWLMQELARHKNIVFVDSRTTRDTVALETAKKHGLVATRRDVFLDNHPGQVQTQFRALIAHAKKYGTAVGIGHPHPETVAYLRLQLPKLAAQGIDLVRLPQLIQRQTSQRQ